MQMKKTFLDSNIVIYANDAKDLEKQNKAIQVVKDLIKGGSGVISTQVLQEYTNVALKKLKQDQSVVLRQLVLLESMEIQTITPEIVRRAVELRSVYKISFWDSMIIGAAEKAKCATILSEDLNPGQYYSGIVVVNPFE